MESLALELIELHYLDIEQLKAGLGQAEQIGADHVRFNSWLVSISRSSQNIQAPIITSAPIGRFSYRPAFMPYGAYRLRNTFLSSFPTLVLGSAATRTIRSGTP